MNNSVSVIMHDNKNKNKNKLSCKQADWWSVNLSGIVRWSISQLLKA